MRAILNAGVIVITGIAILVGAFFALNAYIYHEKQGGAAHANLSGTIVCLPHKAPDPQTKECRAGLRTDSGMQYAIEFVLVSQELPQFRTGDRLSASGVISNVIPENLTAYDIVGLFSITDTMVVTPGS